MIESSRGRRLLLGVIPNFLGVIPNEARLLLGVIPSEARDRFHYFCRLYHEKPIIAASPVPTMTNVAGSGVTDVGIAGSSVAG